MTGAAVPGASALPAFPASADEPYFRTEYIALHAACEGAEPFRNLITAGDQGLLISGGRHHLPDGGGWDLQSVNGYGGPVATEPWPPDELAAAWRQWRAEQAAAGGVAAFFRLHPLLDNARWLPDDATIRADRQTVYVPLDGGSEAAWRAASPQHRNMVRKAERLDQEVLWNQPGAWQEAADLYASAMDRLQASDRHRFGPVYFTALEQQPWAELATLQDRQGLAAMAVFLFGARWSHYHLAARRPDAGNHVASLLLQAGIGRSVARGLAGCHLGGGLTAAADDPLLRFKRSLGGRLLTFQVAGVILDAPAYDRRMSAWTRRAGRSPGWFLGYREPLPPVTEGSD